MLLGAFALAACGGIAGHPGESLDEAEDDLSGTNLIKVVRSGQCADVYKAGTASGTPIQQWGCNGNTNQQWQVKLQSDGTYNLVGVGSGKCMDVYGASLTRGAPVNIWTCSGHSNQKFKLIYKGSGQYEIRALHSNLCLDVAGNTTTAGAKFEQWTCNDQANQRFTFSAVSGGTGGSTGTGGSGGSGGIDCSKVTSWGTAARTWYTSYPDPGSEECIKYSGCEYEGMFQNCNKTMSQTAVQNTNIISVFPATSGIHIYCLKASSGKTLAAYTLDTCGDSDCGGCCTENKGSYSKLIDIEKYTNQRLGSTGDSTVKYADMGAAPSGQPAGCN
jgi:hypothetical protein